MNSGTRMFFSIPILVEESRIGEGRCLFRVRPLFRTEPVHRAERLSRALSKLSHELQDQLGDLGRNLRHDDLAKWATFPTCAENTVTLRLELAADAKPRSFLIISYPALDRRLCFIPALPELVFEWRSGQSLEERATQVLTRHFRDLEKDGETVDLDEYVFQGRAYLGLIEVSVNPTARVKSSKDGKQSFLSGGPDKKEGDVELRKTGRSLQALYPNDLDRAVGRENEVEELGRLLASKDRRPVLLVGPRLAGKTAIIHELAWQIRAKSEQRFAGGREIWLMSPSRLISGMKYLGEWENRVLAILEHAGDNDKVLYFDDLPGLFSAGKSMASDLTVAQVLRPALEKRRVRVLAEITPEAWRILRERDRAFADLFHVIPVRETNEQETLAVMIVVARELESRHGTVFHLYTLPLVHELHRRLIRDAAFPGKAVGFLRRMALGCGGSEVDETDVLREFSERSGMDLRFLDDDTSLPRAGIVRDLQAELIGQDHAVEAFADVLVTLKAKLNDPRRPLGTMLLLGPTGVGKTQAAKALAKYVFADAGRLLRFDMNEYLDGTAVARLCGTENQPEGLLTGAVRRQPFGVLLFDEIEKASPEVFDILLAVLDEGRLTDAQGRVADFTHCLILLTSNLGARESVSRLGFAGSAVPAADADQVYISVAEKFFRPEFFNRLDRIIPFRSLEPVHLEKIARQAIDGVLSREGLRRRECLLTVEMSAITRLVRLGYHPQLGARALKRVIEREIAQPMAEKLAALPPNLPMIARISATESAFSLFLHELRPIQRSTDWSERATELQKGLGKSKRLEQIFDGMDAFLQRVERLLAAQAPEGKIELDHLSSGTARYFYCREQYQKVEELFDALESSGKSRSEPPAIAHVPRSRVPRSDTRKSESRDGNQVDSDRASIIWRTELQELAGSEAADLPDSPLATLLGEAAFLETLTDFEAEERPAVLILRAQAPEDAAQVVRLAEMWRGHFDGLAGISATSLVSDLGKELKPRKGRAAATHFPLLQALYVEGPQSWRQLPPNGATILVRRPDTSLGIVTLEIREVSSLADAKKLGRRLNSPRSEGAAQDPGSAPLGPVLMSMDARKSWVDFRSALAVPAAPSPEEFRALMFAALPLPPEIQL